MSTLLETTAQGTTAFEVVKEAGTSLISAIGNVVVSSARSAEFGSNETEGTEGIVSVSGLVCIVSFQLSYIGANVDKSIIEIGCETALFQVRFYTKGVNLIKVSVTLHGDGRANARNAVSFRNIFFYCGKSIIN